MHKSKKGAIDVEEIPGILTVMIVATILIFVLIFLANFSQSQKSKQITISLDNIDANSNLVTFLRFQVQEDKIVADLITDAYLANDYKQLKTIFNNFFADIYATGFSYDLIIAGKSINSVNFIEKVAESSSQLPVDREVIKVDLIIGKS